jgi:hypothetical protein
MVMLEGREFSAATAHDYLVRNWSDLPSLAGWDTTDAATVANIPGGAIAVAHMPVPIPAGDLTGPIAVAWHWPEAGQAIARHQSHVIVHASSTELSSVDLKLFQTKLAAAIIATNGGIGVYVGDAMLVRSAADFGSDAANASVDNLPIISWIGFNPVRDDNSFSVYTTGLTAFGLNELEVRRSTRPVTELFGTLADLANYQLSSGKVLKDGDTFGATELDRTRVVYRQSEFIPDTTVAVVELPDVAP